MSANLPSAGELLSWWTSSPANTVRDDVTPTSSAVPCDFPSGKVHKLEETMKTRLVRHNRGRLMQSSFKVVQSITVSGKRVKLVLTEWSGAEKAVPQ
jgi:hypothetical protein